MFGNEGFLLTYNNGKTFFDDEYCICLLFTYEYGSEIYDYDENDEPNKFYDYLKILTNEKIKKYIEFKISNDSIDPNFVKHFLRKIDLKLNIENEYSNIGVIY